MATVREQRHLLEAAQFAEDAPREDGAWKVRIISEGRGSSGTYTRELLENFHHAFDDVLSFTNHPGMWEGPETRDFTMIAGEIIGETWVEDDERGMAAVFGWYLPNPEYAEKLERYRKKLGVSIYIAGDGYINENGDYIVDYFDAHDPYRSLDVVIAAGARGKFMESMKKAYSRREENASAASAEDENDKEGLSDMAEKDVLDKLDTLIAKFEAGSESSQKEAQAEVDAEALKAESLKRVEQFEADIKSIEAAELLPSQVESLRTRAREGVLSDSDIEQAKKIATEAREAAGATRQSEGDAPRETGRFSESETVSDYKFRGFGGSK